MTTKCLLWDFDGTLSSIRDLRHGALLDVLKSLYPQTHTLTLGHANSWWDEKSNAVIFKDVEQRYKIKLPADIHDRVLMQFQSRLSRIRLQWADTALHPLLNKLTLSKRFAMAVTSNGEDNIVHLSVNNLGAHSIFPTGNIHTIKNVTPGRGKPFPDLFLGAAKMLGHTPAETIVVGDSLVDLHAAQSAGMGFIGYTGCALHPATAEATLRGAGAQTIIRHYKNFPKL